MPPDYLNSTVIPRTNHNRIGLLVPKSIALCTPGQQARIALQLQQKIPWLQLLIVHETDPTQGSRPEILRLTREEEREGFDYSSLGVFYLPYSDYTNVFSAMQTNLQTSATSSWFLMDPDSASWQFSVRFGATVRISNSPGITVFYWLRFFLFTLLIATPCFRAAYLWYSGGGRLHWRRNDNGRITGILYVPPMPVWLWDTRNAAAAPVSDTLTEEQFQQLPAITYKKAAGKKYHEDASSLGEDAEGEQFKGDVDLENQATQDTIDTSMSEGSATTGIDLDDEVEATHPIDVEAGNGDSAPTSSPEKISSDPAHTTTCTMCSICIDDFENGETLILLPICKHAFHRECIHPWLLERQGCCPMCKVNVMQRDPASDASMPDNDASSSEVHM